MESDARRWTGFGEQSWTDSIAPQALAALKDGLRLRLHQPIPVQGKWLGQLVGGYMAYHGAPTNFHRLDAFRHYAVDHWRRALKRRSQRDSTTWDRMTQLADAFIPRPRITRPWPSVRFRVKHPRWQPGAQVAPAGICAGGPGDGHSYRDVRRRKPAKRKRC